MYQPLHWFNKLLRKQDLIQDSLYHSWQVMNGSFTPADLRPAAIIENDRPYAALTVLETTISRFDMESGRRRTAKLALGIIGTRISETIQTFLHNLLNHGDTMRPHTPKGWPNQISDKGEPTLLYSFQDEWILGKRPFEEERKGLVQAKMGYKYSVGYFTSVGGVFEIRVGKIDHHNWFNDANHLVDVNKYTSIAYKTAPGLRKEKSFREAYVFLSLMPNIVLYNALLNGQFERSPHTANFSETKHFVMEGDTGAGVTFYNRRNFRVHNFILRLSAQTPEYEFAGTAPRWHYWGGLEFNWWKIKR